MLDEHFKWSDGTTSRRVWTLKKQPDGSFRGTADDVVGEALGEVAGNALRWRYVLALPVDGKIYNVDFDDWMFLMDDKVMMNRSYMTQVGHQSRRGDADLREAMSNPKITDWRGKRVWLVGASTGIGAAFAAELARRGARLALSARNRDKLRALGIDGALLLPCDATDTASLHAAHLALLAAWGGVDLVIYLAGDYVPMRADDFDLATAEQVVAVNFNGAMRLAATVLPDLQPGGGIAFVASVAGYRGLPKALAYGPGKAALIHFAECLCIDLAPQGHRRLGHQSRLRRHPADRQERLRHAGAADPGAGRAAELVNGFAAGRFEIHFPKRFTRVMKLLALLPYRWYFPLVRRFTGG